MRLETTHTDRMAASTSCKKALQGDLQRCGSVMLLEAAQMRTTYNSVKKDKHGTALSALLNLNGTSLTCSRHEN